MYGNPDVSQYIFYLFLKETKWIQYEQENDMHLQKNNEVENNYCLQKPILYINIDEKEKMLLLICNIKFHYFLYLMI